MTGAQAVIAAIEREGIDTIFGYPGGAIIPLYDALYQHSVRHILVRHEAAAVFGASGYARTSHKVGVCCATSGPGATNLVTGLLDAMMDSVPIVAITAQVRSELMGTDGFQEADVCTITQSITKKNFLVTNVNAIASTIAQAFDLARQGRPGPVLVDISNDILKMSLIDKDIPSKKLIVQKDINRISDASICDAVSLILSAKQPIVIVGGGVRTNSVDIYRQFVKLLGIPHTATINALGAAMSDDSTYLGMVGMHGLKAANKAIQQADLIIALGMRFDDRVTGNPDRFAKNAKVIHADIDATEFNKIIIANVSLHGELHHILQALMSKLSQGPIPHFDDWTKETQQLGGVLPSDQVASHVLSATNILDCFFAAVPKDAIITTDVGQHQMWAAQRARPMNPKKFATSAGLGSMGFGFPAAIGAAYANPGVPVFAIVGDGGFQMCLPELATLHRYNIPVKIILIDNQNLGMVRQWQELFFSERYSATNLSDNPNFVAIAQAYKIDTYSIDSPAIADDIMEQFIKSKGPALLHCVCHPLENVWPMIPAGMTVDELMEARA